LKGPPKFLILWPGQLEDFGVHEILTLAQHVNKNLSTSNINECKQALCNKWYEFKVLGKEEIAVWWPETRIAPL
jgi:hypothetical protein